MSIVRSAQPNLFRGAASGFLDRETGAGSGSGAVGLGVVDFRQALDGHVVPDTATACEFPTVIMANLSDLGVVTYSAGVYTINQDGFYRVTVQMNTTNQYPLMVIRVAGTAVAGVTCAASPAPSSQMAAVTWAGGISAGETVGFFGNDSGWTVRDNVQSGFMIERIG